MKKNELYTKERPEHGYRYYFRENGVDQYFKLDKILCGEGENTVYQFINLRYGNNTRMTLKRFNYKWRHHSGKKIPEQDLMTVDDILSFYAQPKPSTSAKIPVEQLRSTKPLKLSSDKQVVVRVINKLESLTKDEIFRFNSASAETKHTLSEYIELLKDGYSDNSSLMMSLDTLFKRAKITL